MPWTAEGKTFTCMHLFSSVKELLHITQHKSIPMFPAIIPLFLMANGIARIPVPMLPLIIWMRTSVLPILGFADSRKGIFSERLEQESLKFWEIRRNKFGHLAFSEGCLFQYYVKYFYIFWFWSESFPMIPYGCVIHLLLCPCWYIKYMALDLM